MQFGNKSRGRLFHIAATISKGYSLIPILYIPYMPFHDQCNIIHAPKIYVPKIAHLNAIYFPTKAKNLSLYFVESTYYYITRMYVFFFFN